MSKFGYAITEFLDMAAHLDVITSSRGTHIPPWGRIVLESKSLIHATQWQASVLGQVVYYFSLLWLPNP